MYIHFQCVNISILTDLLVEPDETFSVTVSSFDANVTRPTAIVFITGECVCLQVWTYVCASCMCVCACVYMC